MIPRLVATGMPVIWRAHIGLDLPNDLALAAWHFLIPYVELADAYVFARPTYAWEGLDPTRTTVIAPSIDAFSPKNQAMSFTAVAAVLRAAGLAAGPRPAVRAGFERLDGSWGHVQRAARMIEEQALRLDTPLVVQVSRWDRLKDPLGVLAGFVERVHADEDPHLALAGPDVTAVADDPEGAEVLAEVEAAWHALSHGTRRRVHLALLPMEDPDENAVIVNALQRRGDVIVQKSLAEGFGLTVAEAMWKGRPVVASGIGGIQDQIEHGRSGLLVKDASDLEEYGAAVRRVLNDGEEAARMGKEARTRVRDEFLGTRSITQYFELFRKLERAQA